jgi:prolyl oligopeptidase
MGRYVALTAALLASGGESLAGQQWHYPAAPRADVVDVYFGTRVADPYRPLEELDAPATKAWVDSENAVTFGYLATIPRRDSIRARLTAL